MSSIRSKLLAKLLAYVLVLPCLIGTSGHSAIAGDIVHELKFGALHHDTPNLWSGFRAESSSAAINLEVLLKPSMQFLGGTIRPAIGASLTSGSGTSNVYIDARWQYEFTSGLFIGLGIGGTVHNGQLELRELDRKALGSRVLFHFPFEIGYRFDRANTLSAYFEHISNGYTVSPNEGLDRIGIRYGHRF